MVDQVADQDPTDSQAQGVAPPLTTRADRRRAQRRRDRRQILVAATSTVVVLGTVLTIVLTSPGWPVFRKTFLSGTIFSQTFPHLIPAFWLDIRMFLVVEVAVLILGLLVALCRTVRIAALFPLRLVAIVYTDVLRGIPTILVLYLIGFGVPALALSGLPTNVVTLGGISLALCYGAYVSEVFRAGLESIHPSQASAALALGLSRPQALRFVVVPQAVRRVIPPLLNDFISLQKDVALVSIIGPQEVLRVAEIHQAESFNFTPFMAAALLYLCITVPMTRFTDHIQRRRRQREFGGASTLGL